MNQLEDTSPMPFGKFKGKPMSEVPASYLWWLWDGQNLRDQQDSDVADYIRRNKAALSKEMPDSIW